jgi:hypothetical protein
MILKTFDKKNILFYLLVFLFLYGIAMYSYTFFKPLSHNPLQLLSPDVQWIHTSPIQFFIGYPFTKLFGSKLSYIIVQMIALILLISNFMIYLKKNNLTLKKVFPIIILTPLLLILTSWFGKPDLFLIAGYLMILNAHNKFYLLLIATIITIFSHPQISFFYIIFTIILFPSKIDLKKGILSIIIGYSIYFIYILSLGEYVGKTEYIVSNLYDIFISNITNPLSHIALTLNWLWLVIIMSYKEIDKKYFVVIFIALGVSFGTLDFTRVFTLLSFPSLLYLIKNEDIIYENSNKLYMILPMGFISLFQLQVKQYGEVVDSAWSSFWVFYNKDFIEESFNHFLNLLGIF